MTLSCPVPVSSPPVSRVNGHSKVERAARDSAMGYDSTSMMSSELESSSFIDSEEDEDASRCPTSPSTRKLDPHTGSSMTFGRLVGSGRTTEDIH